MLHSHPEPFLNDSLERLFCKKYLFARQAHWKLPEVDVLFTQKNFQDNHLQETKQRLNSVKSKLNDVELEVWSTHTFNQSPSPEIVYRIRHGFNVEFVTQAWTKFYECLGSFCLIPDVEETQQPLNTVHLCEAPGAFVVALNHFLKTHRKGIKEWSWCASTLNVYYEGNAFGKMISDDRFIHTTLDNWEFGADKTGDITCRENVDQLVERCSNMGQIHLVTADGSVNCTDAPDCQEELVSHLHLAETVAALRILALGGCFVLKMFTFFESSSICLIYLLTCIFKSVTVFKPVTSKGGNSEVYVICEYLENRLNEDFLEKMFKNISNRNAAFFPAVQLPRDFLQQLYACTGMFSKWQIDVIEGNIASFDRDNIDKMSEDLVNFKQAAFFEFCKRYKLENLPEKARITKPNVVPSYMRSSPRITEGSYTERVIHKTSNQIKENHRKGYIRYNALISCSGHSHLWTSSSDHLCPMYGKPFKKISCSVFILSGLLYHFLECQRDCMVAADDDASMPNCRIMRRDENSIVIEMKAFCHVVDHPQYFRDVVAALQEVLKTREIQKIFLSNFCPLSQMTAGLLFLLSKQWQSRIYVNCIQGVITIDVSKQELFDAYRDILDSIVELLSKEDLQKEILLSLIDIRDVYKNPHFHKIIRCYNNHLIMRMFHDLIS
ncbi:cap-specific mRNA (nucleoside-2'-O-)-methyltransferase 2 [Lutzomyia longipalpis]|nr:cap-specific mRNA (nucleoside-2'-O-)-methyltransferase 2 [Lutzomyia longipalpis]